MYSFDQVKELMALVVDQGLGSIEIERSGFRLKIVGPGGTAAFQSPQALTPAAMPVSLAAGTGAEATPPKPSPPLETSDDAHTLTSPLVGTFYVAPSPDAEPFVRVGDRVSKGQVVCIVEAMKLMNEVEADVSGVVREVFPSNAQAVEYGEPLLLIELG